MREAECRMCGDTGQLEAAHVVPRSLGGGQGEHSTIPLCRTCHSHVDAHRVDWLHVLTYDEQAEAVRLVGIERARRMFLPSESDKRLAA